MFSAFLGRISPEIAVLIAVLSVKFAAEMDVFYNSHKKYLFNERKKRYTKPIRKTKLAITRK